jgi:hypothetical protein
VATEKPQDPLVSKFPPLHRGEFLRELWNIDELGPFNKAYQVEEYAPGLLLFGSSAGNPEVERIVGNIAPRASAPIRGRNTMKQTMHS